MSSTMESRGAHVGGSTPVTSHQAIKRKPAGNGRKGTGARRSNATAVPRVPPTAWQVDFARPGDHHAACQLLTAVQAAPSPAEFQAQLEDPFCDPQDRLFCRLHQQIAGHARLVKREMRFGTGTLPICHLADFAVLPEYRGQGCGSTLLAAAEREMAAEGAVLGIVRTQQPHFFLRRGWSVWTRHSYSTAGAREILAQILQTRPAPGTADVPEHSEINIRWWRHIELPGMMRLYDETTRNSYGPLRRTEAYWQWLLSRRAFDRIYVAMLGPDRFDLDEGSSAMVGYAVMKDARIVEMVVHPDSPQAAEQLLARVCSDTIESDGHYVRLEAPVGDPLHHLMARAGGELGYHESQRGEVCLAKTLDIPQMFEHLNDHLHERSKAGGMHLPAELGLQVDGQKFVLEIRPRCVKLRTGRHCRSYLECTRAELTQLLQGHMDVKLAAAAGRVNLSTRVALETAEVLFPQLPLWRPPWDELPAK